MGLMKDKIDWKNAQLLYEQVKRTKEIMGVIKEGEGEAAARTVGGTSSSSSGAYISAAAWEEGGVLTNTGRKDDIGELPQTVDITGGGVGSFEIPAQQAQTFSYDDPHGGTGVDKDPIDDPGDPGDPGTGAAPYDAPGLTDCPCTEMMISYLYYMGYIANTNITSHPLCCASTGGHHDDEVAAPGFEEPMRGVPCCEPCPEKKGWWRRCNDDENENNPCIYPTISDCELAKKDS